MSTSKQNRLYSEELRQMTFSDRPTDERVRALMTDPASDKFEKLLSPGAKLPRTVCAFANTDGGIVLIGVSGKGKPEGTTLESVLKALEPSDAIFDKPSPTCDLSEHNIDGNTVVAVRVRPSDQLCRLKGGQAYRRISTENSPILETGSDKVSPESEQGTSEREGGGSRRTEEPSTHSFGASCDIQKETPLERRCLRVDDYACVLTSFFQHATGEFFFGLFGNWGRGKTYLMKVVETKLPPERYDVVRFSAWKYKTTPELWVYLYETFANRCRGFGYRRSLCISFLKGIYKYGYFSLFLSLMLLGVTLMPITEKLSRIYNVYTILGTAGFLLLIRSYLGYRAMNTRLKARYLSFTDHKDKLGLQALIGDDLKALLMGWNPKNWYRSRHPKVKSLLIYCAILFVGYALLPKTHYGVPVVFAGPPIPMYHWYKYWLFYGVFVLWCFVATWCFSYAAFKRNGDKKFLLIIDDLDRCHPTELVTVVDSVKLFLEDDDIHERVQVVMLLDETVLRKAIAHHFNTIIDRNDSCARYSILRHPIVNEHIEKVLVSYLRLPELDAAELGEAARRFINRIDPNDILGSDDAIGIMDGGQVQVPTTETPTNERTEHTEPDLYSEEEVRCLIDAISQQSQNARGRIETPRSIRTFLFKYQLCRLLITRAEMNCSPNDIIRGLFEEMRKSPLSRTRANTNGEDRIRYIVRQVA